ncbi:ComF family protein [uncultured Pseudoteredinibacter sp.]|uniref:ComF family protein n=1 Tax=uncultured Pseudoteredinibacter sp. TaxID=1641701 RepID=UPI00261383A0|nr:ComF family protein [uncultured Pseudoteredinibacter sp.]
MPKQNWATSALNVLIANRCLFCGSGGEAVCRGCFQDLPWLEHCCKCCALPIGAKEGICGHCQKQAPPFQHCISLWSYDFPIDKVIKDFKYQHNSAAKQFLCLQLAKLVSQHNKHRISNFDALLAVPSHPFKRLIRGYNQAYVLAREVSKHCTIPLIQLIKKSRWTGSQQGLGRKARLQNLENSFQLTGPVKGMKLLLVDDVITTTSTASIISHMLMDAGAESVSLASLARTPQHMTT